MAQIHGLVYIIVGLFVSIVSWQIDYERFVLFFFTGLLFILIGAIKLILGKIGVHAKQKESIKKKQEHLPRHPNYCSNCGNALRINERFCNRCGARV